MRSTFEVQEWTCANNRFKEDAIGNCSYNFIAWYTEHCDTRYMPRLSAHSRSALNSFSIFVSKLGNYINLAMGIEAFDKSGQCII